MPVPLPRRQRLAAYALLLRDAEQDREVLLTQMSARTRIEGRWTLPGGGVDHGEDPRGAVVREVFEETGLHIRAGRVLDVHSSHFVGPRSDGVVEDYHGVHVIFAATLDPGSVGATPRVVEEDGSTARAAWVPVTEALALDLLSGARHALEKLTPDL
jgi:8-oxo-dGTP pyrophosphatase MutT (NUDIX family)